jgi:hypothetical protein
VELDSKINNSLIFNLQQSIVCNYPYRNCSSWITNQLQKKSLKDLSDLIANQVKSNFDSKVEELKTYNDEKIKAVTQQYSEDLKKLRDEYLEELNKVNRQQKHLSEAALFHLQSLFHFGQKNFVLAFRFSLLASIYGFRANSINSIRRAELSLRSAFDHLQKVQSKSEFLTEGFDPLKTLKKIKEFSLSNDAKGEVDKIEKYISELQ